RRDTGIRSGRAPVAAAADHDRFRRHRHGRRRLRRSRRPELLDAPVKRLLVATVLLLFVAGCATNKNTPNALSGAGSESSRVAGVWWLAFGAGAAVYAIVGGLVVFGALRKGSAEVDERTRTRERVVIVVGGVAIPF